MKKIIAYPLLVILPTLLLHGCGGSSSGADVTGNAPPPPTGGGTTYTGPVALTADVSEQRPDLG